MHILILSSSTNDPSNSDTLAEAFARGIQKEAGMEITKLRLKDLKLNHFTLMHYEPHAPEEPDFVKLKDLMLKSKGLVVATPIWNFSVPAHLKNMIDRMGAFCLDPETHTVGTLKGLPLYVIFTGAGGPGSWAGLMRGTVSHVVIGLQYFGTTTVGTYFEPRCRPSKTEFGTVVDKRPNSLKTMEEKGLAFAKIVKQYAETGKLPLGSSAGYKVFTIGQRIIRAFGIAP